jgi:DNA-binding winged helix-turn-helix (wHTH) protein
VQKGCKKVFIKQIVLFLEMKWKYSSFIIIATVLFAFFVALTSGNAENKRFKEAKDEIKIRKIGHEILLYAGDSTSRVLPIKRLSDNEYQLQFESRFSFQTDSLVNIIHRLIVEYQLSTEYIVKVKECASNEVIFGYAIQSTNQNSIVPCLGRKQPENCYLINLQFEGTGSTTLPVRLVVAGASLAGIAFLFFGLQFYSKKKKSTDNSKPVTSLPNNKLIKIGNYVFNNDEQYLIINEHKTKLTGKESALLFIFATNPNQIIDRRRLQKEVWEDDGVLVTRSLDMFISKLRKKLEKDSSVKFVSIQGKGYKLEINPI